MSDIHIHIDRETPVKVITLEPNGARGAAATVSVGTTTTGSAGTNASVTNSGTSSAAVFNFTIPRGATGAAGPNSVTSATTSDATCELSLESLQVGQNSVVTGSAAAAIGECTASSSYAFAAGYQNTASGGASIAFGSGSTASGTTSFANGVSCVASADFGYATGFRAKAIHIGASVESDSQDADVESLLTNEKTFRFANGYRFLGGSATFTAVIAPQEVKSANFTAANGGSYVTVNNATVTDPTPSEGANFSVLVRNGTATVGGTAYSTAGSLIRRIYHSGAWQSYEYKNHAQYGTLATVNGGTGVATALAVNIGSAGALVVNGGALGTPSSGTLTSCTGLPISTGVSGLGTNVATFLATPTSANLAAAVTDETGSGSLVFADSPTITSPTINALERNSHGRIIAMTMTQSPPCALFEDFLGASGAGIYTWTNSGTGSDSVGANGPLVWGVRRMTTGTTSTNQRRTILAIPTSTIFGIEIRAHFAIPDVTTCDAFIGMEQTAGAFGRYFLLYAASLNSGRWVLVSGTGAGVFTNFGTNGPANGSFASGKRYRTIMRPINATTVYVKIEEADWNGSVWTSLHDANVTITSYTPSSDPMALDIRVNTQTNAARSLDIDYISAENTSIIR
jgi:hypothetical protein